MVLRSQSRGLVQQLTMGERVANRNCSPVPTLPKILLNGDRDIADDHSVLSRTSSQRFTPIELITDDRDTDKGNFFSQIVYHQRDSKL